MLNPRKIDIISLISLFYIKDDVIWLKVYVFISVNIYIIKLSKNLERTSDKIIILCFEDYYNID